MEIIILILLYVLSVIVTRYAFIKVNITDYKSMLLSFAPILNLFFFMACFFMYVDENYNVDIKKISDWFFGIKK